MNTAMTNEATAELVGRLRAWPATGNGNGLDALVVRRLMQEAAAALSALPVPAQAQAVATFKCDCGKPLSRTCPACQKAWES